MADDSMWQHNRWQDDRYQRAERDRAQHGEYREGGRYAGDRWAGDRDYGPRERPSGGYGSSYEGYGRGYDDYRGYERPASGAWGRQDYAYGRDSRDNYGPYHYARDQGRGERGFWDRASDEISSWFGDEDASARRRMDESQTSHRGRGPKGYSRSDERIREDVSDRLSDDHMVDASEVEVSVSGGEVTLSGTVDSREQRRRAEDCAERVSGVGHVQNNLRVKPSTNWNAGAGTAASTASTNAGLSSSSRNNSPSNGRSAN